MSVWIVLLAAYGAVTIWQESYQPWLVKKLNPGLADAFGPTAADMNHAPPFWRFFVKAFHLRYGAHAHTTLERKPWSCSLCMAFLVAIPFAIMARWFPTQVIVVGFAASAASHLLDMVYKYMRVVVG